MYTSPLAEETEAVLSVAEFVTACRGIVSSRRDYSAADATVDELDLDGEFELDSLDRLRIAILVETLLGRDLSDEELSDGNFGSLRAIFRLSAVDLPQLT